MKDKSQFRDYSNITICNETVQEIKELIESKAKDESEILTSHYFEREVITLLLARIYELREAMNDYLGANKKLAQERNDLKDELWHLKYGKK